MMANTRIQALIWDVNTLNAETNKEDALNEFILALRGIIKVALSGSSFDELSQVLGHRWEIVPAIDRLILLPAEAESLQPDTFTKAANTLRTSPEETVWVGSQLAHIENARAAGLWTVEYQSPAQVGSELFGMLMEYA
jgi:beta-phosphoglucomutase-like phosphatase (HAD superfamily)